MKKIIGIDTIERVNINGINQCISIVIGLLNGSV